MNNVWLMTGLLTSLIVLELGLRLLGFGNPLLYLADPNIGYLLAPNQQTRRLGKRIAINQYSMRSPQITAVRPTKTLRVLLLGDSIVNGGWWTDQAHTISALLQQQLQEQSPAYADVEVLNASANSWAPRNQLAYLQRFSSFDAQIIVLVINTDDLFAPAPASVVVGRDRNYPDRKPALALIEVIQRYALKPKPIPELAAIQAEGGDRVGANLAAIQQIQDFATQHNAKFILLVTPLLRELEKSGLRDYEQKARQRLQTFTQAQDIPFVDFLSMFSTLEQPSAIYRDHIHLNLTGNQQVTQEIAKQISALLDQE
jgi:lysophospholipase L1-like esterase